MFTKTYKAPKINHTPPNQRPSKASSPAKNPAPTVNNAPVQSRPNPPSAPPPAPPLPNNVRRQQAQALVNVPPPPPPNTSVSNVPQPPVLATMPLPPSLPPVPGRSGQSAPKAPHEKAFDKLKAQRQDAQQQITQLQTQLQSAPPQDRGKIEARIHALQDVEGKMARAEGELQTEINNLGTLSKMDASMKKGEITSVANQAAKLPGDFNASVDQWYGQAQHAAQQQNPTTGATKNKLYLGRFDDVKRATGWQETNGNWDNNQVIPHKEARRLDAANWNLGVNEAFIQGGIDQQARFKFKTPLTQDAQNILQTPNLTGTDFLRQIDPAQNGGRLVDANLWDANNNRPTVTAREIAQIVDADYRYDVSERNQQKHPGAFKHQMIKS